MMSHVNIRKSLALTDIMKLVRVLIWYFYFMPHVFSNVHT